MVLKTFSIFSWDVIFQDIQASHGFSMIFPIWAWPSRVGPIVLGTLPQFFHRSRVLATTPSQPVLTDGIAWYRLGMIS